MNPTIKARDFAEVTRRLREQGVSHDDSFLGTRVLSAYQMILGGSVDQRASQMEISLPDLEDYVQTDIVKDNILAMSALYYVAQLEDLKFFMVMDRIADHFQSGMIPLRRSTAGDTIYKYIRSAHERFNESERRGMYARAFGMAQGAVDEPMPNREFGDLWLRFLSSVDVYNREAPSSVKRTLGPQTIMKNARDLAVNLTLHGYGIAYHGAVELQQHVVQLLDLMRNPELQQAYGVLNEWQLVERVSDLWLGGAVNSTRQRTLATTGKNIIKWLADNQPRLTDLTKADKFEPVGRDGDLVRNIERWLAATGTDDAATDKFSDAVSVQSQPTLPNLALRAMDPLQGLLGGNGTVGNAIASLTNLANTTTPVS